MAKIGIRLADGRFYPILDEDSAAKKRIVLTTVKDEQPSVQIDLYRSEEGQDPERSYIASLVIENIPPLPRGEPDIRLDMSLDDDGNLKAYAIEEASGEHQALNVSLKSLELDEKYDVPDFDFQEDPFTDDSETGEIQDPDPFYSLGDEPSPVYTPEKTIIKETELASPEKEKKRPVLLPILLAIAALGLILALSFLVFKCVNDREMDPPPVLEPGSRIQAEEPSDSGPVAASIQETVPEPAPEPLLPPEPEPEPEPAVVETVPAEPVAEEEGFWYKIRWGDTLWDLANTYYRNPWLYGRISRYNGIKNPDLIISGTMIYIPKP